MICFLSALAGAAALAGESPDQSQSLRSRMREDLLRMNDFFDTTLPGTLEEYNIILKFSPKFSDLRDNEFIRYPLELRYGLTPRWELFGGMTPYHPNPFNEGRDHAWGFGEARLGARYDLRKFLGVFDQATVGFESRLPLGTPPEEIIGRYTHLRPFLLTSRKLAFVPDTTFFVNFAYDREVDTPTRDQPSMSQTHIGEVGPGFLYKPGEFGAFASYRYRHITRDIGSHNAHDNKVGVLWDVPLTRTQRLKLPGKWQLELAYKYNVEEGYETDQGVTARVSWRTTLREVLKAPEKSVQKK
ncbi:MAG TPA: hypothetical protein VHO24_16760 [Opitutaceae bacterium]|nr:hypothetical protein [Opitutaceae bacterium]